MSSDNLGKNALDIVVINEPEKIRAVMDPLRCRILSLLRKREMSIKELTDELKKMLPKEEAEKVTPQKVNYHVKALERLGLITVAYERNVEGRPHMMVKFYKRCASKILITYSPDNDEEDQQDYYTLLEMARRMGILIPDTSEKEGVMDVLMKGLSLLKGAYRDVLRFFEQNGCAKNDAFEPLNVYLLFFTFLQLLKRKEFGELIEKISKLLNYGERPPILSP
ncbi:MAG: ArsR/SmtB family transcription factor [Candidatus Baldrarchaeia archaeon]